MSKSMFADSSENEVSILIPGYSETVVIRPLTEAERQQATAVHPFAHGAQEEIYRNAASIGIVRIGERENEKWLNVLTPEAIQHIGNRIMSLTRNPNL